MGNCCAAQKPKGFDDSKRPLKMNMQQSANSDSASVGTRPSTPGHNLLDEDEKPHKTHEESPTKIGIRRPNNLNPLESLAPRDPPSRVNSVQSSTIPGDGISLTSFNAINKTHLGSSAKSGMVARSRAESLGIHHRRSVISAVSEFK